MRVGGFGTYTDGSSDYYLRVGGLEGAVNHIDGIFSAWVRMDGGDGSSQIIFDCIGSDVVFQRTALGKFEVMLRDVANNPAINIQTNNIYLAGESYHHFFAAWRSVIGGEYKIYIDNVDQTDVVAAALGEVDYTQTAWSWGVKTSGLTNKLNGVVAEGYFAPAQYLQPTVEANRRKFISESGKPVYLGIDGSLPTGTAPLIYAPDGDFSNNLGTGGNFTKNGTPVRVVGPGHRPSRASLVYQGLS